MATQLGMSREPCEIGRPTVGETRGHQPATTPADEGVVRGGERATQRVSSTLWRACTLTTASTTRRPLYLAMQIRRQKSRPDGRHVLVYPNPVLSRKCSARSDDEIDDHLFCCASLSRSAGAKITGGTWNHQVLPKTRHGRHRGCERRDSLAWVKCGPCPDYCAGTIRAGSAWWQIDRPQG